MRVFIQYIAFVKPTQNQKMNRFTLITCQTNQPCILDNSCKEHIFHDAKQQGGEIRDKTNIGRTFFEILRKSV